MTCSATGHNFGVTTCQEHGGKGGTSTRFDLGPSEYITKVWGRWGNVVDSINIQTK